MCGQRASAHGRAGEAIGAQLRKAIVGKPDAVVCVDCYHGVWEADVLSALTEQLNPSRVFCTAQATLPKEQVNAMLKDHLTDDRVFGIMAHYRIEQFFDMERVAALRQEIALAHGVRLVFGVGAALLCEHPDVLVYADMARWEIQARFRSGKLANWLNDNYDEDPLRKYKRGYFIEWRVLDRHKRTLHSHIDYLLDTNDAETPPHDDRRLLPRCAQTGGHAALPRCAVFRPRRLGRAVDEVRLRA